MKKKILLTCEECGEESTIIVRKKTPVEYCPICGEECFISEDKEIDIDESEE